MNDPLEPYDAVLMCSYGGPRKMDDVLPFMRNATSGRGVPDERLLEVSGHYKRFHGISPINARNNEILHELALELRKRGSHLPMVLGNRNWTPFFHDVMTDLYQQGARKVLALFTSAYVCYSGCRQYREDLAAALEQMEAQDMTGMVVDKARAFYTTKGFVEANVDAIVRAFKKESEKGYGGGATKLLMVTHSIPADMAEASGPCGKRAEDGSAAAAGAGAGLDSSAAAGAGASSAGAGGSAGAAAESGVGSGADSAVESGAGAHPGTDSERPGYVGQHMDVSREVVRRVEEQLGHDVSWELAFCSRSGPPHIPWLEPDINDVLERVNSEGVRSVVVSPIGFICDHMEVVFDLDTEAFETAQNLGLSYTRADSAGTHPAFISSLADVLCERAAQARGEIDGLPAGVGIGRCVEAKTVVQDATRVACEYSADDASKQSNDGTAGQPDKDTSGQPDKDTSGQPSDDASWHPNKETDVISPVWPAVSPVGDSLLRPDAAFQSTVCGG